MVKSGVDGGVADAPAVSVRGLRVVRGGRVVLPDLNVDVPAGEVVGLLGPSGSGKTTLMRCIVGVQKVEGGTVTVLGRPAGSRELRHAIGYVTQAPSVYGDLTVTENIAYFAAVLGLRGERRRREVERVLELVALADHSTARVDRLSGGQLSRVSLAAALLGEPELLVLDEPTVGLDPVLRRDLWTLFRRLAAEGKSLLVSSHVMDEASRCDRLLLMRAGGLLADDTPQGVLASTGTDDVEQAFLTLVDRAAGQQETGQEVRA
jgi:ABC-2 type transport system ATP-binding protein